MDTSSDKLAILTWTWQQKGNVKEENESLLIVAQNNSIGTNYVMAKIKNRPENSKCQLCKDRDEIGKSHNKRMQQTRTKGVQDQVRLGGKGDPLGIVQKIKV